MNPQQALGQMLLVGGAILLLAGAFFYFGGHLGPLGRLPGDFRWEGKGGSFSFPLVTSLLVSLILTILLNVFLAFRGPR
ncbi:MAG: DUF2905 domain-containing protein [bacterium]